MSLAHTALSMNSSTSDGEKGAIRKDTVVQGNDRNETSIGDDLGTNNTNISFVDEDDGDREHNPRRARQKTRVRSRSATDPMHTGERIDYKRARRDTALPRRDTHRFGSGRGPPPRGWMERGQFSHRGTPPSGGPPMRMKYSPLRGSPQPNAKPLPGYVSGEPPLPIVLWCELAVQSDRGPRNPAAAYNMYKKYWRMWHREEELSFINSHSNEDWFTDQYSLKRRKARILETIDRASSIVSKMIEAINETWTSAKVPLPFKLLRVEDAAERAVRTHGVPLTLSRNDIEAALNARSASIDASIVEVLYAHEARDGLPPLRSVITIMDSEQSAGRMADKDEGKLIIEDGCSMLLERVVGPLPAPVALPNEMSAPERIAHDSARAVDIALALDANIAERYALLREGSDNEVKLLAAVVRAMKEKMKSAGTEERDQAEALLDAAVYYLWHVHNVSYYEGTMYKSKGDKVSAGGTPPYRSAVSEGVAWAKEKSVFEKDLDKKHTLLLHAAGSKMAYRGLKEDIEREIILREESIDAFCKEHSVKEGDERYLCTLSGKRFTGLQYVRRHILSKHLSKPENSSRLEAAVERSTRVLTNAAYARDPERVTATKAIANSKLPESAIRRFFRPSPRARPRIIPPRTPPHRPSVPVYHDPDAAVDAVKARVTKREVADYSDL